VETFVNISEDISGCLVSYSDEDISAAGVT